MKYRGTVKKRTSKGRPPRGGCELKFRFRPRHMCGSVVVPLAGDAS